MKFVSFWRRSFLLFSGGSKMGDRSVFRVQLLLLVAISTLLYLPLPGTAEWRRFSALGGRTSATMVAWDELAWFIWLFAAPLILLLIRRFPLERDRLGRNALRVLVGSGLVYLLVLHARFAAHFLVGLSGHSGSGPPLSADDYLFNAIGLLPLDLVTFSGFFAVSFAVDFYFKLRERAAETARLQLRGAQLESELARSELAALRGQLHPHFLFNSFNAVATLVRQKKNDVAVEVIAQLSALLRMAIDRTGRPEVTLEDELDFIRRYLDIEHVRFADKLRVEFAIEPAALGTLVPNIVLQPLVENAIKHGISRRTSPGLVRLSAVRAGGNLRVTIENDGPEEAPPAGNAAGPPRRGIGLANTKARLDRIYGTAYRLHLSTRPDGGAVVELELPWRPPAANQSPDEPHPYFDR